MARFFCSSLIVALTTRVYFLILIILMLIFFFSDTVQYKLSNDTKPRNSDDATSIFEQEWVDHIGLWQSTDPKWTTACAEMHRRIDWSNLWLDVVSCRRTNETIAMDQFNHIFSRLIFEESPSSSNANGAASLTTHYIEPLVGALRHPYFVCVNEDLFNKTYILLPKLNEFYHDPSAKKYFFDLGASVYNQGAGGPSQQWFLDEYERHGIRYDRYFAWEAAPVDPHKLWSGTPLKMKMILSYFNIPASPDPKNDDNVVKYIRTLCRPEDYCAVKIDIDNNAVETELIELILASPDLHPLIDDLFWEHHVLEHPMMSRGWDDDIKNMIQTTADSYRMFTRLREVGILAHSWV